MKLQILASTISYIKIYWREEKNRNSILKKVKQTSNSLCRPPHFEQEIR